MQWCIYLLIWLCLFFCKDIEASAISSARIQTYVSDLSANTMQGRLTGTQGETWVTQYVANVFRQLGLEPAGDNGTFFQDFKFIAGVALGKNNVLSIFSKKGATKHLVLNRDWRPLYFSDSASFTCSKLIFAGYGITAPATEKLSSYDSYKHINVKNKCVIVLRDVPEKLSRAQSQQLAPYSSLRYKAFTAKEHGAKGIIIANGSHDKALIPFASNASLSNSGIIAISITNKILHELHRFKMTGQIDIKKRIQHGRNVLAKLNVNPRNTRMIIVGAHVDHLGVGDINNSTLNKEIGMIHPGADDNASGVASMLENAAALIALKKQGKLHGHNDILFAAWSGEELGILGSSYFVKKIAAHKSLRPTINAVINLDMIGHLRDNLILQGVDSSSDWLTIINQVKQQHPISLMTQNDPYLPTDSTSFYLHGVPILNFFTGAHDAYHTPRDKPETLNYSGMKAISEFLLTLTLALEDQSRLMNYHAVQNKNEKSEREFKIYLGTIPDYASADVVGVKISGVAKNSPAEQAGLKANDIIIQLAGKPINDIYDYTFVLNKLSVGQPTKLIVLREQKKVILRIVARYRL